MATALWSVAGLLQTTLAFQCLSEKFIKWRLNNRNSAFIFHFFGGDYGRKEDKKSVIATHHSAFYKSQMTKVSRETTEPTAFPNARYENASFNIRLAHNREQRTMVQLPVQKLYGQRGYQPTDATPDTSAAQSEPGRITLMVNNSEGHTVGTVTIRPDGPEGLMADALYRAELDMLCSIPGVRLLELASWRWTVTVATHSRCWRRC